MSCLRSAWCLLACALVIGGCGDDGGGGGGAGGGDAAVPIDGAAPCENDDMCADGVYCNGDEVCDEGQCVYGPRRVCDDSVLCTVDTCSESIQACRHTAPDLDGDGHASVSCVDTAGDPLGDDCDDDQANRYPGNREVCDPENVDEDCDDSTYGSLDQDNDEHDSDRCCNASATNASTLSCGTDCDDLRASTRPGATEICDQLDNDCDDKTDESVAVMQYVDADRDGHGAEGSTPVPVCASSVGFSPDDIDCNDLLATVHGAQVEICDNGVDNDCDEEVDEEENAVAWYVDADGDGFGDPTQPAIAACVPPEGRSILRSDCDDTDPQINPGTAEVCDAADNDCNGLADFAIDPGNLEDDDGDGSADAECVGGPDCDDKDPTTGNGLEICDGYDNDCDDKTDEEVPNTVWYLDRDGDGFGDTAAPAVVLCAPISGRTPFGGDCNDANPTANPDAKEVCNGRDDNCDGVIDGTQELVETGCVGTTVLVGGRVFAPQGGTTLRSGQGARPNKPQGTTPITHLVGAKVTIVHHTGVEIATTTTNANGAFNIRVPRGIVFVIVEPPDSLAAGLVGSAIPIQGPRSNIEVVLHVPSELSALAPTALADNGVIIANVIGAGHAGDQGVLIDPSIPTMALVGIASQMGNTLPPYDVQTWIPGSNGAVPFAAIAAVDVPPGGYGITPLDPTACGFTEGNYFGNAAIWAQSWPVRPNVITWVPVDCSPGLGDCCTPHCGSGCSDPGIDSCMQALDPGDCGYVESTWDDSCVHRVTSLGCSTCPAVSSCFAAHFAPGCDDPSVQDCVCNVEIGDPTCCTGSWTQGCVAIATSCNYYCD